MNLQIVTTVTYIPNMLFESVTIQFVTVANFSGSIAVQYTQSHSYGTADLTHADPASIIASAQTIQADADLDIHLRMLQLMLIQPMLASSLTILSILIMLQAFVEPDHAEPAYSDLLPSFPSDLQQSLVSGSAAVQHTVIQHSGPAGPTHAGQLV